MNSSQLAVDRKPVDEPTVYRYFPGWTMVAISGAAQFMSAPGQSYSVAAFKEPMRAGLEITETQFSLAYAFATIISGVLLPFVGRLIDRLGARKMLPAISFFLGLACLGMSYVTSLGTLYIGFSFVRSLGQGALTLVAAWLVGEWFLKRRGFASSVSGLGGSLSVMTIPLLNVFLISQYGWQTGWVVLAFAVWVILLLPSLFFVRDRPEELGLLPDGDVKTPESDSVVETEREVTVDNQEQDWSVASVLRDVTFWKLLAVPATSGMVGTGLIFHAVSLLGSRGISSGWSVALISFQALIATCLAMLAGWLTDRLPGRYLLAIAMFLLAVGGFTVLIMPHPVVAIFYAINLGIHGSILRSTGMVVWMSYYGRKHQGEIRGIAMAVMILAAAVGPLPLAMSIDYFSTYDPALYVFIAIPLLSGLLVWTAGPPRLEPTRTA